MIGPMQAGSTTHCGLSPQDCAAASRNSGKQKGRVIDPPDISSE
jgi:hypothetical protein